MNLQHDDLRFWLRQQQAWNDLRVWQRAGWREMSRRILTWPRILRTAPIPTVPVEAGGAVEYHVLCHGSDWLLAIWMLKSLLYFAPYRPPLVIHVQKAVRPSALAHLRRHFPGARIILPETARQAVARALLQAGHTHCLHWWHTSGIMHKLLGVQLQAQATNIVGLDADILFFNRPAELLAVGSSPWPTFTFQQDQMDSYTLSPTESLASLGIPLASRVNTGLVIRAREALNLARIEELLKQPLVAKPSGHLEQTLYALCASEAGRVQLLPPSYGLDMNRSLDCDALVCRHYAGPSKRWITSEGMRWLIRRGLLKADPNS